MQQVAAACVRLALAQQAKQVPCHATLAALAGLCRQRPALLQPHLETLAYLAAVCGVGLGLLCTESKSRFCAMLNGQLSYAALSSLQTCQPLKLLMAMSR